MTDIIRDALGPTAGLGVQTTKLADNVKSLTSAVQMLQSTVQTVQQARPEVRQKLAPILAQSVQPLLVMGQKGATELQMVAAQMSDYIDQVADLMEQARALTTPGLKVYFTAAVNMLLTQATATKAAAAGASQMLTNYEGAANRAAATLNTYGEQLDRENQDLQREAQSLKQRMHDMTSGNCCQQVGHAFQLAFGHLKQELEADESQIRSLEYVYAINLNALDGLKRMVDTMGDISAVSSSLELSWRSQADSVLTDTSPADIQADMEYVQSDWQSIADTLHKIA